MAVPASLLPSDPTLDLSAALRGLIWPQRSAAAADPMNEPPDPDATDLPGEAPESWAAVSHAHERPEFQSVHVVVEGHPASWVFGAAGDVSGSGGWPAPQALLARDWAAAGGPPDEFTFECCDCGVVGCGGFWASVRMATLSGPQRAALAHPLDLDAPGVALARAAFRLGSADPGAYLRLTLRARESGVTVWVPQWAADPGSWALRRALQEELEQGFMGAPAQDSRLWPLLTAMQAAGLIGAHDQPARQGGPALAARRAVPSARLQATFGEYLDWQVRRWGARG